MSPDDIISLSTFPLVTHTHRHCDHTRSDTSKTLHVTPPASSFLFCLLRSPFLLILLPPSCPHFLSCSPQPSLHSSVSVVYLLLLPTILHPPPPRSSPLPSSSSPFFISSAVQVNFVSPRRVFWLFSWSDTEGLFTPLPVLRLFRHLTRTQMRMQTHQCTQVDTCTYERTRRKKGATSMHESTLTKACIISAWLNAFYTHMLSNVLWLDASSRPNRDSITHAVTLPAGDRVSPHGERLEIW